MPETTNVSHSEDFDVCVYCEPIQPIKAFEFEVEFNSTLMEANLVTQGSIFDGYSVFFNEGIIDNVNGTIKQVYGLTIGLFNTSDNGTLVSINFTSKCENGTSALEINGVGLTNETMYIPVYTRNGIVVVS